MVKFSVEVFQNLQPTWTENLLAKFVHDLVFGFFFPSASNFCKLFGSSWDLQNHPNEYSAEQRNSSYPYHLTL